MKIRVTLIVLLLEQRAGATQNSPNIEVPLDQQRL